MIKQKNKTFIIFFLLFFLLVNPNNAIIHFYFLKNKKKQRKNFFSRCSLLYTLYYIITSLHFTQLLLLFIPILYIWLYAPDGKKTKTLYSYSYSTSYSLSSSLIILSFSSLYSYPTIPPRCQIQIKTNYLYLPCLFSPGTTLQ